MKRHCGARKAKALIELANHSVGSCEQLEVVEKGISTVLEERIPYAKSSVISLAGILGEAGDLSGFAHGNALLRHAGLNLAEASSGKWTGQMKISKRGRSRLRRFLFMATMSLVMNNSEFQAMHAYNVQFKKMKKMRSIMKLCGKLARILVGMARSGKAYMPQKTLPLLQAV